MSKLRSIFMGTPDFSVPCLAKLEEITDVVAVVTQPDKPKGRGQRLVPTPVKKLALEKGYTVYQPVKVREEGFCQLLEDLHPDIIIVVAFGQILPKRLLDIPPLGCINVHASLLPRYRGAAPMQWCLINGEAKTGVTTMFMDVGLDTGDMLLQSEIELPEDMNLAQLHDAMMVAGADLMVETIQAIAEGKIQRIKQEDSLSNYAPMINKETGHIDWSRPARAIHNLVRGLDSWPGAYTLVNDEKFKIWKTRVIDAVAAEELARQAGKALPELAPGQLLTGPKNSLFVATGDGLLELLELQVPGKKRMRAGDYLRGHGAKLPEAFA